MESGALPLAIAAAPLTAADSAACAAERLRYNFLSCLFLTAQNGFGQDVEPFLALSRETWGEEQLWAAVKDLPHGAIKRWKADGSPMWERDARGALVLDTNGGRVWAVDPFGAKRTRLMFAAQAGNVARLRRLLAQGARLELKDLAGRTALCWASSKGRVETARELLTRGASVDTANNSGAAPLYIAIEKGYLEVVRELLARGAAVNSAMNDGATPLLLPARRATWRWCASFSRGAPR